jgi:RimJ/RimL family protein N-acetyltransferase
VPILFRVAGVILTIQFLASFPLPPGAYSVLMSTQGSHVVLRTPRLVLRQFTAADEDNLVELNSDPEVMRYLTDGIPTPREEIRDRVIPFHLAAYGRPGGLGTWAAETPDGEFLGWFHFRPGHDAGNAGAELGYRLRRAHWGSGYATEGSLALIERGFTALGVERAYARTLSGNAASRRVMEKCGLRLVRTAPYAGPWPVEGAGLVEVEYALTRAEWEAARTAVPPGA